MTERLFGKKIRKGQASNQRVYNILLIIYS